MYWSGSAWRYVNLSDACQMQLAARPAEALKLYRRRVDPVAEKWYEEGIARRDAKLLDRVVQQAFASSWGDKALMALGEIHLEEGDFSAARWCWERILPVEAPPRPSSWPGYPDSTLDPAAVRRGWCWSRSWRVRRVGPERNFPNSSTCTGMPVAGWAVARCVMPLHWPNC